MLLTGVILGAVIVLLLFAMIYFIGANRALKEQVNSLQVQQQAAAIVIRRYMEDEEQRKTQPMIVNIKDDQITNLADRIGGRVQMIIDARDAAALKKMS
jgi:hypothetical protein